MPGSLRHTPTVPWMPSASSAVRADSPLSVLTEHHRAAGVWLFDFDGTLTDYQSADQTAVEVLRRTCFEDVPAPEFRASSLVARTAFYQAWAAGKTGVGLDQSRVGTLCDQYGRTAVVEHAVDTYRTALLAETRPASGAEGLFEHLARSRRLGIVTNAYDAEAQRARIAATGLDRWVEVVVVAVEVGYFKPDPRIMLAAAEALGVASNDCIYVGDSHEFDITAATGAGMHPLYVGAEPRGTDVPCFSDLECLYHHVVS